MPRGDEVYVSKWLKASDLVDDEMTLTITGSDITTFKERNGDTKQQIYLEFEETEKPLGLNKTNYSVLQSIFRSPETDDWVGKKIVIFVTQTDMQGQTVDCIRIKRKATETLNAGLEKQRKAQAAEQARRQPQPPSDRQRPVRATAPLTQEEVDADDDEPF